jgi:HEPN domain-containing protein
MSQDQATFHQLAELRLAEAKLLLAKGLPSGAYYLAGYAVECALKARIASKFQAGEIPDLKLVQNIYTHELPKLLNLAGLKDELEEEMKQNPELRSGWAVIAKWSERDRYEIWTTENATVMLQAVGAQDQGLLQWLQKR